MDMNILKNFSLSKIILFLLFITMICSVFSLKRWSMAETPQKIINWDVTSYYSYLPAIFIYHDITFEFLINHPEKKFGEKHEFFFQTAPNGSKVAKFTMGTAIMYAPFFFIAHLSAHLFNYEANGFSAPYEFCLALSSLFYLLIGLFHLRKTLLLFFNESATSITLISIMLGTNLYYYSTSEPAMSHTYSFSLVSIWLFQFIKWYNNPNYKRAMLLGLLFGLIVLIRPVNCILLIFPWLYDIYSGKTFLNKINFILINRKKIILIWFICFLVFIPQLIYWKYLTGHWLFYSYLNEIFYFSKLHILDGLLSYRNGWLVYSPIMIFSIIGIFILSKKNKNLFFPVLIFFLINIYIAYSWWTWWYGGSFGSRPMIDSYPIMALPFAALFQTVFNKSKLISVALISIIIAFVFLNLFQSEQKRTGIIHWDAMSKEAYWNVFLKSDLNFDERVAEDKLLVRPDYDKALLGKE